MLLGSYDHKIDDKGRFILPVRFRKDLGSPFFCTVGIEKCITLYSLSEWKKLVSSLSSLSESNHRTRDLRRVFYSMASEVTPDRSGRIALPVVLREYAEIEEDVTAIGVNDRVELWRSDIWVERKDEVLNYLPNMIEDVMD